MEITQLKHFQTLAKLQNMTHAANALHIAQPALSRTLRVLERELGLQLFDRIGKHIYLNEYGNILLRHTNVILQELSDTEWELQKEKGNLNQRVSISMHAGSKLLPDLIRGFRRRYPDISLQIVQQGTLDEALEKSDITVYSSLEPVQGKNRLTLMEEEICLAMPINNPMSELESINLSDVAYEPFICLYKGKGLRTVTDEFCNAAGFAPNIVLESDSPSTVRDLIALGVGLSFVPMISWNDMECGSAIKLMKIGEPKCRRYLIMAWRSNHYVSRASVMLQKYLTEFFDQLVAD